MAMARITSHVSFKREYAYSLYVYTNIYCVATINMWQLPYIE